MRNFLAFVLLILLTGFASAHEFWLEPGTFRPDSGTKTVPIDIKVGMNYAGNLWRGELSDIISFSQAVGSDRESLIPELGLNSPTIPWVTRGPGQYLVGLTNKSSFIELSAEKFKSYVLSEGLESIVKEREELGESEKPGRELYRRCVKLLLQQGSSVDKPSYDQLFGFPVEFQAMNDPYEEGRDLLTFKLLAHDKPVKDALVMVWQKNGDNLKRVALRTKEDGTITLLLRQQGVWMVSSVHMERTKNDKEADWQSYWASFTFGYQ